MGNILLFGGILLLLINKNKNNGSDGTPSAASLYPPIPGGKNLVYNNVPLNEFDLPLSVQVYSVDFPLKFGDEGSVIAVFQQLITQRDFEVTRTGVFDEETKNAWASTQVSLDDFVAYATDEPSIVGKIEIFDYKPPQF